MHHNLYIPTTNGKMSWENRDEFYIYIQQALWMSLCKFYIFLASEDCFTHLFIFMFFQTIGLRAAGPWLAERRPAELRLPFLPWDRAPLFPLFDSVPASGPAPAFESVPFILSRLPLDEAPLDALERLEPPPLLPLGLLLLSLFAMPSLVNSIPQFSRRQVLAY